MKTTIDYSKSPAPAFDAVEDIKEYLGERYDQIAPLIKAETNRDNFAMACSFAGIHGYPVKAWYEHFHGQGSWPVDGKGET